MINAIGFSTENNNYYQSTDSIGISTESISREIEFEKRLISKEVEAEIQTVLYELNAPILPIHTQATTQKDGSISTSSTKDEFSANVSIKETDAGDKQTHNVEISNSNVFKYDQAISNASLKYNVPERLIHSVIKAESGYDKNAKSSVGALGLMQLMPATASSLGVKNPLNPDENIDGGVKYLSQMIERYDGNITLGLAAYNAGPGNVDRYGGVPPFEETQNYIKKILN